MKDIIYNKIIALIPSETLKNKIKEIEFKIKDLDLVYIVDHYVENVKQKVEFLNDLLNCEMSEESINKIEEILNDINRVKLIINNEDIISNDDYDQYRNNIWVESNVKEYNGISIGFVTEEYKPKWPIFLNKFDLVKIKPYYDPNKYHYGFINHFQNESIGPKATICLFESVKENEINSKASYNGEEYYIVPDNYSHDHILLECIEKVELDKTPKIIKDLYLKIMDGISNRVNVIKYFYSDELKVNLKNHKFTDIEKANIISNSIFPYNEKIKDLSNIRENTSSYSLYKQLSHYINSIKNMKENLSKCNKDELYELMNYHQDKYYFLKFDEALQKGIELTDIDKTFQIKRIKIGSEHYNSRIYVFNYEGELLWNNDDSYNKTEINEELFYNSYVDLPNIFQNDGYRVIRRYLPVPEFQDDEYNILIKNQAKKFTFRDNLIEKGYNLDLGDSGPYIYFISSNGDVYEEPFLDFVNMYYVDDVDYNLAILQDIEFIKSKEQ